MTRLAIIVLLAMWFTGLLMFLTGDWIGFLMLAISTAGMANMEGNVS